MFFFMIDAAVQNTFALAKLTNEPKQTYQD